LDIGGEQFTSTMHVPWTPASTEIEPLEPPELPPDEPLELPLDEPLLPPPDELVLSRPAST
jgi:hypothetical protein